mmetsp:Transcript_5537/g.20033  ORF Transcript_5537/g.20033 Transcript_5537/m.20033 type:complete len:303 (+) Transcript_5537:2219-3127(+)
MPPSAPPFFKRQSLSECPTPRQPKHISLLFQIPPSLEPPGKFPPPPFPPPPPPPSTPRASSSSPSPGALRGSAAVSGPPSRPRTGSTGPASRASPPRLSSRPRTSRRRLFPPSPPRRRRPSSSRRRPPRSPHPRSRLRPSPRRRRDAQPRLPARERRHGDELEEKLLLLLLRAVPLGAVPAVLAAAAAVLPGVCNLEKNRQRRVVRQRAQLPRRRPAAADANVRDRARKRLLIQRRARADAPGGLHVPGRDDLEHPARGDAQRVVFSRREHSREGRLEDDVGEALREHHHPSRLVHAHLHLL